MRPYAYIPRAPWYSGVFYGLPAPTSTAERVERHRVAVMLFGDPFAAAWQEYGRYLEARRAAERRHDRRQRKAHA